MRRTERQLVQDYSALVDNLLEMLPHDAPRAAHVAGLMDGVRGFEHVKQRNLDAYRTELAAALATAPQG